MSSLPLGYSIDGEYEKAVEKGFEDFPRAPVDKPFSYGTAGFRMRADLLDYVMLTVGVLASLRSRKLMSNTIGIMITASHNPAEDNGVKLVDPSGDMLEETWEHWATAFANAWEPAKLKAAYINCIEECKIDQRKEAHVIIARDTRPSGDRLVKALIAGLEATGTKYTDYGYATTPQLHYLVRAINTQRQAQPYGEPSEEGYYKKLGSAFTTVMQYANPNGALTVDCANGIGAPKLKELIKYLPEDKLQINIVNDRIEQADLLNEKCGADFVKTQQRGPQDFVQTAKPGERWCSFDGDADRIIYYFNDDEKVFRLLDGDRIATLAASFIGDLVRKAGLEDEVKLAVVQTAYANGASTRYIEQTLKLKVECTATGVKHLHHVAARYDIGVYFEANGHGTVLFHPRALKAIRKHEPQSPAQLEALDTLKALTDLINQTVGDALSDMLLVEAVLAHKEWTVKEWNLTYKDLPNKLAKVNVADRSSYRTAHGSAERQLEHPTGLQAKIDDIVKKYQDGRCFVRASGTEDAVRVYGEAAEIFDVEDMVTRVIESISST